MFFERINGKFQVITLSPMTNRNYNSLLRTITFDFGCGFGVGVFFGILCSTKVPDFTILGIVISGLLFGVLSAIFGRSFWLFNSKRKVPGFPERKNPDVEERLKNKSVR